jgi:hypothetical protein
MMLWLALGKSKVDLASTSNEGTEEVHEIASKSAIVFLMRAKQISEKVQY